MTRALQKRGYAVEVACLDAPGSEGVRQFPAEVHAFGPGRGSYGYTPRLVPWLRETHSKFDAVIVHGIWQYQSFATWLAVRRTTTPYFVFPHGMLDPWFKRTYPLKHLKKLLYWPWAEYRVLRDAAAVIFTSEQERKLARESFARYRCHEVVVNLGIEAPDVNFEKARGHFYQRFPQLQGRKFLLFLGRIHVKKGVEELLEAFASTDMGEKWLVMAGPCADGSYLDHLRRLTSKGEVKQKVIFTGMLSGETKWGAFAAADAFILPSHQENFGIAVVEALSCGKPVLISNQINIWREIVEDGSGIAESDSLEGTKRLLERWLATSPEQRQAMSEQARRTFANRFEINRSIDSLLAVMQTRRRAE
jgi:glycosyltransferase involved in cell wall biosynthesis